MLVLAAKAASERGLIEWMEGVGSGLSTFNAKKERKTDDVLYLFYESRVGRKKDCFLFIQRSWSLDVLHQQQQ